MSEASLKYTSKLSGQRVLVIGGTSGIGYCVAEAALAHGASVIVSSSKPEKVKATFDRLKTAFPEQGEKIQALVCDLSDPQSLESNLDTMLKEATEHNGPIDHIVDTAGDALGLGPVSKATVEHIQKVGHVRFLAPLILAKLAPKYQTIGPGSSITLTGGVVGARPPPNWTIIASYSVGLEGMVRGLAVEYKPVRVNLVAPGAVHTERFNAFGNTPEKVEAVLEQFKKMTLTGEVGRPEDLAEAYIYLMKDRFITGSIISSNGGMLLT